MVAKSKLLDSSGGNDMSFLHNNAAKDDCLAFSWTNTYKVSDLLANDPGSAHGIVLGAGATLSPDGLTFSLAPGVTQFDYTEQEANGTFSSAHVNLAGKASGELVQNWSFETTQPGAVVNGGSVGADGQLEGGFTSSALLPGWTNNNGVSLEDVTVQYGGFDTGIAGDTHWLDTQGSPGGIDISQMLKMTDGSAHMSFVVAAEPPITVPDGQVFKQDPNEILTFSLDHNTVATVSQADFANIGTGVFHQFTFDVNGITAGFHTLEIASTGANNAFVGYALDSVSVQQIIPLPC